MAAVVAGPPGPPSRTPGLEAGSADLVTTVRLAEVTGTEQASAAPELIPARVWWQAVTVAV